MSLSINPITVDRSTAIVWGQAMISELAPGCGISAACIVAEYEGSICWLDIAPDEHAPEKLFAHFSGAAFQRNDQRVQNLLNNALKSVAAGGDLQLRVTGTPFQLQVWRALTDLVAGGKDTYGALASRIGRPGAARAVGSAAAANTIALFIPCHRLVPAGGGCGSYRWGAALKRRLLEAEGSAANIAIYGRNGTYSRISDRLS